MTTGRSGSYGCTWHDRTFSLHGSVVMLPTGCKAVQSLAAHHQLQLMLSSHQFDCLTPGSVTTLQCQLLQAKPTSKAVFQFSAVLD